MAFKPFSWKNRSEGETTPVDRQNLNLAEEAVATYMEGVSALLAVHNTFTKAQTIEGSSTEEALTVKNKSATAGLTLSVFSESESTHAATINMAKSGGSNSAALNVVSSNINFSAFEVTGVENTHGTIKVSHVNKSGTGTGDANAAMLSLEVHKGEEANTAVQGVHIAEAEGSEGSTGSWITCQSASGASKNKEFRVLKGLPGTYMELREVEASPGKPESGHVYIYFKEKHMYVNTSDNTAHEVF